MTEIIEREKLTETEAKVIAELIKGKNNGEIATDLNVSMHTVKAHVCNVLQKLNLENRINIVNYVNQNPDVLTDIKTNSIGRRKLLQVSKQDNKWTKDTIACWEIGGDCSKCNKENKDTCNLFEQVDRISAIKGVPQEKDRIQSKLPEFTTLEKQIIGNLLFGKTVKDIAMKLGKAAQTIAVAQSSIFSKFDGIIQFENPKRKTKEILEYLRKNGYDKLFTEDLSILKNNKETLKETNDKFYLNFQKYKTNLKNELSIISAQVGVRVMKGIDYKEFNDKFAEVEEQIKWLSDLEKILNEME